MKKRIISLVSILLVALLFAVPVYAAVGDVPYTHPTFLATSGIAGKWVELASVVDTARVVTSPVPTVPPALSPTPVPVPPAPVSTPAATDAAPAPGENKLMLVVIALVLSGFLVLIAIGVFLAVRKRRGKV